MAPFRPRRPQTDESANQAGTIARAGRGVGRECSKSERTRGSVEGVRRGPGADAAQPGAGPACAFPRGRLYEDGLLEAGTRGLPTAWDVVNLNRYEIRFGPTIAPTSLTGCCVRVPTGETDLSGAWMAPVCVPDDAVRTGHDADRRMRASVGPPEAQHGRAVGRLRWRHLSVLGIEPDREAHNIGGTSFAAPQQEADKGECPVSLETTNSPRLFWMSVGGCWCARERRSTLPGSPCGTSCENQRCRIPLLWDASSCGLQSLASLELADGNAWREEWPTALPREKGGQDRAADRRALQEAVRPLKDGLWS